MAYSLDPPPLEAVRFLIHEAATVRSDEPMGSKVLMINDVSRAFFEAPATRNICVELPKEDRTEPDVRHDKVGHLRMSLYGTRDASYNWQEEVAKEMRGWGSDREGTIPVCTSTKAGGSAHSCTVTTLRPWARSRTCPG